MSQKILYRVQIGSLIQQMCGKTMPQHMRTLFYLSGYSIKILIYAFIHKIFRQFFTFFRPKKEGTLLRWKLFLYSQNIMLKLFFQRRNNWNDAFFQCTCYSESVEPSQLAGNIRTSLSTGAISVPIAIVAFAIWLWATLKLRKIDHSATAVPGE